MYKDQRVAVVVPAYNEAAFVGEVIETVPAFVDRIYAVDDASTDDTWGAIRAAAARVNERVDAPPLATADGGALPEHSPAQGMAGVVTPPEETAEPSTQDEPDSKWRSRRVVPARHADNRGVGAAITTGYRLAVADGMDVVAVMNGDGQMDPDMLDRIVDPVAEGRADYAKGNRLARPEYRESMSRWRLFGNTLLTLLTKAASGYWGTVDPQNGYTAISREAIEALDLSATYDRYGFCNDVLVRANVQRFRVVDVGMPAVYGEESSHIDYTSFVPRLSLLLAHRFHWRLRERYIDDGFHPVAALYGLAEIGLLTTVVYGVGQALRTDDEGTAGVASVLLGLLVSVLSLLLAVASDARSSADLEGEE